ncbi:unnamed protein product [Alopecurus aequalis]
MDHGGKKPRLQLSNLTLSISEPVKPEPSQDEQETGRAIVVASAAAPVVKLVIEFDKPLLDCPICRLPLKPPVFQPAERRRLLAAEDGEQVFLVVASERGDGERHVKVVRIKASAEEGPSWYRCKVWTHAPVDAETGCKDVLMLEAKVRSCAKPSEEAAMELGGRCLHVPSDTPPAAGGIVLRIRIDKLEVRASPVHAAVD